MPDPPEFDPDFAPATSESIEPDSAPVAIFSTSEVGLLPVIRSVLQGAGIPFVIQGEHALGQLPTGELAGLFARRGLGARVLVSAEHAEVARELLKPATDTLAAAEAEDEPSEDGP